MNKNIKKEMIELLQQNPDLPIMAKVDLEIVGDDGYAWWLGQVIGCEICEIYEGETQIHIKDIDDEEYVLTDMQGCECGCAADGRDIYDLSDEEWTEIYNSLPWIKTIIITVGD